MIREAYVIVVSFHQTECNAGLTDLETPYISLSVRQPGWGTGHERGFDPVPLSGVSRIEWEIEPEPFTASESGDLLGNAIIHLDVESVFRVYGTVVPEPDCQLMLLPFYLLLAAARKSRRSI